MHSEPYGEPEPGQAYYEEVPPAHTQPSYPPQHASVRLSEPRPQPRQGIPWLAVICCLVSAAALVIAAYVFTSLTSARNTAAQQATQIAELSQALAKYQTGDAKSLSGLAGQLSDMDATVNGLSQYNTVCAQALVTNTGAGTFYFACTAQKPG